MAEDALPFSKHVCRRHQRPILVLFSDSLPSLPHLPPTETASTGRVLVVGRYVGSPFICSCTTIHTTVAPEKTSRLPNSPLTKTPLILIRANFAFRFWRCFFFFFFVTVFSVLVSSLFFYLPLSLSPPGSPKSNQRLWVHDFRAASNHHPPTRSPLSVLALGLRARPSKEQNGFCVVHGAQGEDVVVARGNALGGLILCEITRKFNLWLQPPLCRAVVEH